METLAATSLIFPTLVESYKINREGIFSTTKIIEGKIIFLKNKEGILTGMFLMSPISTSLASLFARASSFAARPHLNICKF